jgi:hypothetical protein
MWAIKQVLEHNYNNFRCSFILSFDLYREGKFTKRKMTIFFIRCILERMKPHHWVPQYYNLPGERHRTKSA